MENQQNEQRFSSPEIIPSESPSAESTDTSAPNRSRRRWTNFWPTFIRRNLTLDQAQVLVIGGYWYRQYTMKMYFSCGKSSNFMFYQITETPNLLVHVIDESQEVVMKLRMDQSTKHLTLHDIKNDRVFMFSRCRKFFVFSHMQPSGDEVPVAQVLPRSFATKADLKWIRPGALYGEVVAELSRPLLNRPRV